jgi:hypothetical protein
MKYIFLALLIIGLINCQSVKTDSAHKKDTNQNSLASNGLQDSSSVGELIDGPANVRDTVNGKLLFSLFDNVPVETTDTINMWVQVGLLIDVTPVQFKIRTLEKGDTIYLKNRQVGIVLEKTHLQAGLTTKQGLRGELVGYTSFKNIKISSIPEYGFSQIVNHKTFLTINEFA